MASSSCVQYGIGGDGDDGSPSTDGSFCCFSCYFIGDARSEVVFVETSCDAVFDYYITAAYVIFQRNLGLIADC